MNKKRKILTIIFSLLIMIASLFIIYMLIKAFHKKTIQLSPSSLTAETDVWEFSGSDMLPGYYIEKEFIVKSSSYGANAVEVQAKLVNETNNLSNVMILTVEDKDTGYIVYTGPVSNLLNTKATDKEYQGSTRHTYVITLLFDEEAGNEYKDSTMSITLEWSLLVKGSSDMKDNKKLLYSIIGLLIVLFFVIILALVSFLQARSALEERGVYVSTGNIKINLNDNEKIFDGSDCFFQPGYSYSKEFTIENQSKCDVTFLIYFENVTGPMAEFINVTIKDGDKFIASGCLADFGIEKATAVNNYLSVMEKKTLVMELAFSSLAGEEYMNQNVVFDVCCKATQTKK